MFFVRDEDALLANDPDLLTVYNLASSMPRTWSQAVATGFKQLLSLLRLLGSE